MALTAEVIQLHDARRARFQQFSVVLSTLVTQGGCGKGLVTSNSDPKAIEQIQSQLADPDFAARGHHRDDVATLAPAQNNSFWNEIGAFTVYYNIRHSRNELQIESVFHRPRASPDPRPSKFCKAPNDIRPPDTPKDNTQYISRRFRCVAACLFFVVLIPGLYLSMSSRNSLTEARRLVDSMSILRILMQEIARSSEATAGTFEGRKFMVATQHPAWTKFDKRSIALVPFNGATAYVEGSEDLGLYGVSAPPIGGSMDEGRNENSYSPQDGKFDCKKSKNGTSYSCYLVLGAQSGRLVLSARPGKNAEERFTGRIYLSARESESGSDVIVHRTSLTPEHGDVR